MQTDPVPYSLTTYKNWLNYPTKWSATASNSTSTATVFQLHYMLHFKYFSIQSQLIVLSFTVFQPFITDIKTKIMIRMFLYLLFIKNNLQVENLIIREFSVTLKDLTARVRVNTEFKNQNNIWSLIIFYNWVYNYTFFTWLEYCGSDSKM